LLDLELGALRTGLDDELGHNVRGKREWTDRPSVYDRVIRVALVHIVGMEDMPAPAPKSHNGPPPAA